MEGFELDLSLSGIAFAGALVVLTFPEPSPSSELALRCFAAGMPLGLFSHALSTAVPEEHFEKPPPGPPRVAAFLYFLSLVVAGPAVALGVLAALNHVSHVAAIIFGALLVGGLLTERMVSKAIGKWSEKATTARKSTDETQG